MKLCDWNELAVGDKVKIRNHRGSKRRTVAEIIAIDDNELFASSKTDRHWVVKKDCAFDAGLELVEKALKPVPEPTLWEQVQRCEMTSTEFFDAVVAEAGIEFGPLSDLVCDARRLGGDPWMIREERLVATVSWIRCHAALMRLGVKKPMDLTVATAVRHAIRRTLEKYPKAPSSSPMAYPIHHPLF